MVSKETQGFAQDVPGNQTERFADLVGNRLLGPGLGGCHELWAVVYPSAAGTREFAFVRASSGPFLVWRGLEAPWVLDKGQWYPRSQPELPRIDR